MLDRSNIIQRAVDECYEEMYQKAQPSISYKELIQKVKSGEIEDSHDNPVYKKYYLSQEEFEYIRNKYKEAYNIKSTWEDNITLLEDYITKGGTKDKYIPTTMDNTGFVRPGYRSYSKVKPLKEQLSEVVHDTKKLNKIYEIIMNNINDCKTYYRFDREEISFDWTTTLGCSPTSNKEEVIEYWKSQGRDITIEDRNPLLLWDRDYYDDEFEDVMLEEYGKHWKEDWDKKYQEKLAKEEAEKEAKLKEYQEELEKHPIRKFKIGDLVRSKEDSIAREVFAFQEDGYRVVGGFIPFEDENKWYHCYEQFKNYV